MVPESYYLSLSAVLFTIGVVGVVVRRNPLVIFMSIELMLNAANLALVAFGQRFGNLDGQAVVFFVMRWRRPGSAVGSRSTAGFFAFARGSSWQVSGSCGRWRGEGWGKDWIRMGR